MRRTRLQQRPLAALCAISAVLVGPSVARVFQTNACVKPAPTLATLRRSDNTPSNAEVVYSNCSVVKISSSSSNGTTSVDASGLEIQAIASFPDVTTLQLSGNEVTTIYEDSEATVKTLYAATVGLFCCSIELLTVVWYFEQGLVVEWAQQCRRAIVPQQCNHAVRTRRLRLVLALD